MKSLSLLVAIGRRFITIVFRYCHQKIRCIKTVSRTYAHALCQPQRQYRMALLLATILAFLLGWPLFVSTLPHASSACIGML